MLRLATVLIRLAPVIGMTSYSANETGYSVDETATVLMRPVTVLLRPATDITQACWYLHTHSNRRPEDGQEECCGQCLLPHVNCYCRPPLREQVLGHRGTLCHARDRPAWRSMHRSQEQPRCGHWLPPHFLHQPLGLREFSERHAAMKTSSSKYLKLQQHPQC